MRLHTQVRLTIWTLLGLQLCTAVGAIVLLSRMAPAIQNILERNVASLRAVEQMQHALASPEVTRRAQFAAALQRAEQTVTEPAERPVLERLQRVHQAALSGEVDARRRALAALERLATINLAAMERSDQQASRLGEAGAWAVAVLGMLCFAVSIFAARAVARHVTRPLTQIYDTLMAFRAGDTRRRCVVHGGAVEPKEISRAVDQLLDTAARTTAPTEKPGDDEQVREVLNGVLDAQPRPALVLHTDGGLVAANAGALDALARQQELKERLLARLRDEQPLTDEDVVVDAQPAGRQAWLVTLRPTDD